MIGPSAIAFPPRNEPNVFFQDLTNLYRDVLRRTQTSPTYVDPEGENVWLTEYFRFYLNGCSHDEAVNRTLSEISGGTQPVCGAETPAFPPRDLPNAFQARLEATYRDVLRRSQGLSYVDSEGANVWLAQYLRFRVSGCGHGDAENKVFTEIRGGGVQPDCAPAITTTTSRSSTSTSTTISSSSTTSTVPGSSSTSTSSTPSVTPVLRAVFTGLPYSGQACVVGHPLSTCATNAIQMSASGSTSTPYPIVHYRWNCGQPAQGLTNCMKDEISPRFSYIKVGFSQDPPAKYTVTLTIEDDHGNQNTATTTVTVTEHY